MDAFPKQRDFSTESGGLPNRFPALFLPYLNLSERGNGWKTDRIGCLKRPVNNDRMYPVCPGGERKTIDGNFLGRSLKLRQTQGNELPRGKQRDITALPRHRRTPVMSSEEAKEGRGSQPRPRRTGSGHPRTMQQAPLSTMFVYEESGASPRFVFMSPSQEKPMATCSPRCAGAGTRAGCGVFIIPPAAESLPADQWTLDQHGSTERPPYLPYAVCPEGAGKFLRKMYFPGFDKAILVLREIWSFPCGKAGRA
jgi:hypothetical protein